LILLLAVMSVRAEIVALLLLRRVLDHSGGGVVADDVAEHLDCPCMALMIALLFRRLSCVAVYAAPKLETALVSDVVDASSSAAFMPYPCWEAGVAVNAACGRCPHKNVERCEIHGVGHEVASLYVTNGGRNGIHCRRWAPK
jgi:hypothetical protein